MKIAIQPTPIGFTDKWMEYCEKHRITYKLVDCYRNDIMDQISDCDALMWQHDLILRKDNLVASRVLSAAEHSGKIVFPDILSNWHYDDKVAQKYLLEGINAPLVPSFVFYDKPDAVKWAKATTFPKVFKLRGGAGSINVKLVNSEKQAIQIIEKAFSSGFSPVSKSYYLKESIRKFKKRKISLIGLMKSFYHHLKPINKEFVSDRQAGYVYFQDFIPQNDSDIRLVVINQNKVFGLRRFNRENDFRASGSGNFNFLKDGDIPDSLLSMVMDVARKLKMDSIAYDIVFDQNKNPLIIEITYAYVSKAYNGCPGYWDESLKWHSGLLTEYQGWMVDSVIERVKRQKSGVA